MIDKWIEILRSELISFIRNAPDNILMQAFNNADYKTYSTEYYTQPALVHKVLK